MEHQPGRNLAVKRIDWSTHEQRASIAKVRGSFSDLASNARIQGVGCEPMQLTDNTGSRQQQ